MPGMERDADRAALETAARVLGRPCRLLILQELLRGNNRFNALERALPSVTPTTLSRNLKGLERIGMVAKRTYPAKGPRTEYELTPVGKAARPAIQALRDWGGNYARRREGAAAPPASFDGRTHPT